MSYSIRAISFQEIEDYISGEVWEHAPVIPITPERAVSQRKNPLAEPGEPCLWVATKGEDRVVGFAGSLPGYDVRNKRNMGWNTCWWVDPESGKEAAMPLFYRFLQHWDQRVAFADMTPHTHAIIRQLGFCHTREERLVQAYFRISGSKLASRMGFAGRLLYPFLLMDSFLINTFQRVRLHAAIRRDQSVITETRERLGDELFDFIGQNRERDFAHRSMEEFRWIEENPWLVKGFGSTHDKGRKYPFSYEVKAYKLEWLVSRRDSRITSVMMVSLRDGVLKVLYYFGTDPSDAFLVLKRRISGDRRVQSLMLAHPDLLPGLKKIRSALLFSRFRTRYVGISRKILEEFPEELVVQLGDGDSVFT